MKERILVNVASEGYFIILRTVSRSRKSPHRFHISRKSFSELERKPEIIFRDGCSFATLHRNACEKTLEIAFTWLVSKGDSVSGYQETVVLPYDRLSAFLWESAFEGGPTRRWKTLSLKDCGKKPPIVFKSKNNLRAALGNSIIRRKLVRCLIEEFNWPLSERIEIYDDFVPYSFTFKEIRDGKPDIIGGLILHGQEDDMRNAYYSIHT